MKARIALLVGPLFCLSITSVIACGGAIDGGIPGPGGSSSGSSGSSGTTTSGGPAPTTTSTTPRPPTTTSPPPVATVQPQPAPFFGSWSGTASGCANFTVYAADTSNPRYLVIKASKSELGLGAIGTTATVNLASTGSAPSTDVGVDTYQGASSPPPEEPYCTDVGPGTSDFVHRKAFSGTVTFTVTSVGKDDGTYALAVSVKNVVVQSQFDGELETIPDITFVNVGVGWFPG